MKLANKQNLIGDRPFPGGIFGIFLEMIQNSLNIKKWERLHFLTFLKFEIKAKTFAIFSRAAPQKIKFFKNRFAPCPER